MNRRSRVLRRIAAAAALAAVVLAPRTSLAQDSLATGPLTLGDAARLASRQSASALEAQSRTDAADARIAQRRADLLPDLSATASQNGRTYNSATFGFSFPGGFFDPNGSIIGPANTYDLRAHLSQTLVNVAAIKRVGSAKTAAEASRSDADNVAELAALRAASAYIRTQRGKALIVARSADSVLADSLLSIANDQLKAGVGVALDVTRAQSQAASVRAQLIASRAEYDRQRVDLVRSLNLPVGTPITLADSLGSLPVADTLPNEQQALALALDRRPDVRALREQLLATQQGVSAIKAENIPSVDAFGDDGWSAKNGGSVLPTYTWGVQLTWAAFDGGRRQARVEEQVAAEREIDIRLKDLTEQTASDIRTAMLDLESAREQLAAARERLRLAEQEVAQSRDRFTAGVASNADVITASFSLNSSRSDFVDALASYQAARIELAHAEGSVTSLP
ncbi:MAG TPA: TolC family protein [Gemmatimonadaceae bacterium]|nr:TolC family protein [Gemmatimonadaceae bacterium]